MTTVRYTMQEDVLSTILNCYEYISVILGTVFS